VLPAIPDINLALQNVRTSEPMQGMAQDTEVNDRGRVPAELSDQIHGPAALYSPGTLSRHRRCGAARTCRNEYAIRAHIYTSTSILTHVRLDLVHDRFVAFPALW
jgi:hypothetical protein